MENENIMEELIEIQEPDEEHDSVSDMIENIGTNSPSKTSSKDENLEKELTSFDKDCCSASSLKERELSSEVTQDSVQISTKRYFESQQSNEDDCLSNEILVALYLCTTKCKCWLLGTFLCSTCLSKTCWTGLNYCNRFIL